MILSFKTQINGKPTYFVHKIWCGLIENKLSKNFEDFYNKNSEMQLLGNAESTTLLPKLHTIRTDEKNRWKKGVLIDFFINARQKNMFRFAPRIPVVSTQRVFMTYLPQTGNGFQLSINGKQLWNYQIKELALNDGFEKVEDFEDYFIAQMKYDEYSGKIIHWTDLRY